MTFGEGEVQLELWRRCELAWMAHLHDLGYPVMRLSEATSNTRGSDAPLIVGSRSFRAPDVQTVRDGVTELWEVKHRTRADVDELTGASEYWMDYAAFRDYSDLNIEMRTPVWVVLYDSGSWEPGGRWLQASITDLRDAGRRESRYGADAQEVTAWVWPADCMRVISGPEVDTQGSVEPLLPIEIAGPPLNVEDFTPMERDLRRSGLSRAEASNVSSVTVSNITDVLERDARVSLDVLRRSLGIPRFPRYSVVRIGLAGVDLDDLLGLLTYGIRVFLISGDRPAVSWDEGDLAAFRESRMLEWAVIPDPPGQGHWIVDGRMPHDPTGDIERALVAADDTGELNLGQYKIVHEAHDADILITAGAGTGKTETMTERIIFLLATSSSTSDPFDADHPFDLRADEIALVTFTRESAREMRERIARALMLRQRLCQRCSLPATAWLMQLSATEIETIHTYAKRILQRDGGAIGLAPGFAVSQLTMQFRELVHQALSPLLDGVLDETSHTSVPPVHELRKQVEELWSTLSNNGVSPLSLVGSPRQVDWGQPPDTAEGHLAAEFATVIHHVARQFGQVCLRSQAIPTSELVPAAIKTVQSLDGELKRRPRFLFVDEFQDTDAEQMDLLMELRTRAQAHLFVVGDEKQGIYRFRGAEGNAFEEVRTRFRTRSLPMMKERNLTRNFRSGTALLDSLHPYFERWGAEQYLSYSPTDRLRPDASREDTSRPLRLVTTGWGEELLRAASVAADWRNEHPADSVAVLCRRNAQALDVREAIRDLGQSCELRVGGDFYRSPAVLELRVLLEAVLDPEDTAATLELCESRWFAGIAGPEVPDLLSQQAANAWGETLPQVLSWPERVASLSATDSFDVRDLMRLRRRIKGLAEMLQQMPVLAWLMECSRLFNPKACALPGPDDETERKRYARCFDHLITLLDNTFQSAPVSGYRVLEWLRLQIATDRSTDEPDERDQYEGTTTALTIHKAKGLEFDRVVIASTSASFEPNTSRNAALLRQGTADPRLIWKWTPPSGLLTNVRDDEQQLWQRQTEETIREETRLLYVAMTRARSELVALAPRSRSIQPPRRWRDLLTVEAGHR